jgi:hypothetical protein
MTHDDSRSGGGIYRARMILTAFLVFSIGTTVFSLGSMLVPRLRERIVPYTGWSFLGSYMWTLFFAAFALKKPERQRMMGLLALLGAIIVFDGIGIVSAALDHARGKPNFGNPYLTYHPLRPVIILAPQIVWFILLCWAYQGLPQSGAATSHADDDSDGSP